MRLENVPSHHTQMNDFIPITADIWDAMQPRQTNPMKNCNGVRRRIVARRSDFLAGKRLTAQNMVNIGLHELP